MAALATVTVLSSYNRGCVAHRALRIYPLTLWRNSSPTSYTVEDREEGHPGISLVGAIEQITKEMQVKDLEEDYNLGSQKEFTEGEEGGPGVRKALQSALFASTFAL